MDERLTNLRNSPEFAEEQLVAAVQSLLQEKMEQRGMNRADLAAKMGVSRARVTQIFSDNQNFTLRMVARAFHALGEGVHLSTDAPLEFKSACSVEELPLGTRLQEISHGFEWLDHSIDAGFQHVSKHNTYSHNLLQVLQDLMSYPPVKTGKAETAIKNEKNSAVDTWSSSQEGGKIIPLFKDKRTSNG